MERSTAYRKVPYCSCSLLSSQLHPNIDYRSQAIKCPSIHYHLAGAKKVQQELARSGAVELFLCDDQKIQAVKDVFVGLYSLDFDEYGDQAVQMALESPER